MPSDTICKTIHQYNREPLSDENMKKLLEIASDYCMVKNYVYQRYGGIGGLPKIYPGFTVQNEMIKTGLRDELGLPFVYFNLAVFDALRDIRSQWTKTKSDVLCKVNGREEFTEEEKHYLRYLLKVNNAFEAVLNRRTVELKAELYRQYERLAACVDVKRLNNYLCRQVGGLHKKPHTDTAEGFSLTERAYRYGDHGIYITIKEKRKRIFIPLTDNNRYVRQIYIKLLPCRNSVEIKVPIERRVRQHRDYVGQIGVSMGMWTMLVTEDGHLYGERLGEYQAELAEWVRQQAMRYHPGNEAETGREKYMAQKGRMTAQLHSYINQELNRFLRTEKPKLIYLPKLPRPRKHGGDKAVNHAVNMWQRGYIRSRLKLKCQEQSVKIVEVFGKDISSECSACGAMGNRKDDLFWCEACGSRMDRKQNAARNARRRAEAAEKIMGTAVSDK